MLMHVTHLFPAVLIFCLCALSDLAMPVWIGRWSNRGNALAPWVPGYPFRLFATLLGVTLVYTCPTVVGESGASTLSLWFYARVLVVQVLYSLASNILFVSQCSFFARVCDSSIGGSYMTLLNTISNLGSSWPKFFVFAAVDLFSCQDEKKPCGAFAIGQVDGFYIVSAICFAYGIGWYFLMRKRLVQLGAIDKKYWSCE